MIRNGGNPGLPLVVRSMDWLLRPRIAYAGSRANVFDVAASHVSVRGPTFGPTRPGVDTIRLTRGDHLTVGDCTFEDVSGTAVVANNGNSPGLTVQRNRILNSRSTAIFVGCHDGVTCILDGVLVEGNYINGVDVLDPEIGYGVQIKLNSVGEGRDNVILYTKGPGIMVYGATRPGRASMIERNAVTGSRHSAAMWWAGARNPAKQRGRRGH